MQQVKEKHGWLLSKEGNPKISSTRTFEAADVENLGGSGARTANREALDILRKHARRWHQDALNDKAPEVKVPNALLQLLFEIFIYGPPKAKRGVGPKDTLLRYQTHPRPRPRLVHQDFGCSPRLHTNPEPSRRSGIAPLSACRLVGEELGLDDRGVEEILRKTGPATPH